jgi:hypothetical protein
VDYIEKMQPFAAAIRRVDPNATIAIFADPQATSGKRALWDPAIANYVATNPSGVYWDAISFHYYPALEQKSFSDWIADETGVLVSQSTQLITNDLQPLSTPRTKFLITEFDPTYPGDPKSIQPDGTLWGGIYSAEFTMRMSTLPQVMFVGPQQISHYSGVGFNINNQADINNKVKTAAAANIPIDTTTLDNEFGFYLSAQGAALSVLNGAINQGGMVHQTTVTGGPTVAATNTSNPPNCTTNCTPVPALYAVTYGRGEGKLSVVIANKSNMPVTTTINVDGGRESGPFPIQFVSNMEPSATNLPTVTNVSVQTGLSGNPVTVPPFSVMRIDVGHSETAK